MEGSNSNLRSFVHGAYFPSWRIHQGANPGSMDLDSLTHLFYAFASIEPCGKVQHIDEAADLQCEVDGAIGGIAAFIQTKQQNPNLKVLISIGGGEHSENFAQVAAHTKSRDTFAASAKDFCDRYGFDGIDVDWEHPITKEQGSDYLKLLEKLRTKCPGLPHLSSVLNFVNLMCYDFSNYQISEPQHQAQLYSSKNVPAYPVTESIHGAVQYILGSGVMPSKIVIGIPVYGLTFAAPNSSRNPCKAKADDPGFVDYKKLPLPGTEEHLDLEETVTACSYCIATEQFVSYDTPETVSLKARYVQEHGLKGLFYWTGISDAAGPKSLINSGFVTLQDRNTKQCNRPI